MESREVLAPEDLTEGIDGKQEARRTRPPLRPLSAESAAGHYAVHVDMLGQGLAPRMKHGGDAQLCP